MALTIVRSDPQREAARYAEVAGGMLAHRSCDGSEVRFRDTLIEFVA